jgi:hypothetical protein
MKPVKFALLFVFLALFFLVGISGGSPSNRPLFCQAGGADAEGSTTEAQRAFDSSVWCRPSKSIAKRRTDTFAPAVATLSLVTHLRDQIFGRSRKSSAAALYQAAPLYQSIQVYRL